jgi:PAS domain S-box-containing protein
MDSTPPTAAPGFAEDRKGKGKRGRSRPAVGEERGNNAVIPVPAQPPVPVDGVAVAAASARHDAQLLPAPDQAHLLSARDMLRFVPDGYLVTDLHGLIVETNTAAATLLGGRPEFLLGKPLPMFFAADQWQDFYRRLLKTLPGAGAQEWEVVLQPPRGKIRQVRLTAAGFRDAGGRLTGYRWLLHDVTPARNVEQSLREEKEFVDKLLRALPAALAIVDMSGRILRVNPYLEELSGRAAEDLRGLDWCSLFLVEAQRPLGREFILRASLCGAAATDVLSFIGRGKPRLFRWTGKTLGATGKARVLLLGHDVSDLERVRLRLAGILDSAPNAVLTLDESGNLETFNRAAERLCWPGETRARHHDGMEFPIAYSVSEMHEGSQRWFTCIVHDLTQRRELEQQILEIANAEQRRISQDLHDEVGQELTGLSLLADNLVQSFADPSSEDARTAVKVLEGIKRTLRLVRRLSQGLMPVDIDPGGLMAALDDLAARTCELPGVRCTFHARGAVLVQDNTVATHLYRIAKEAVSNALRHGKARRIRISLTQRAKTGTLSIQDDGVGLSGGAGGGMGLKIMRHRAELIGGKLAINNTKRGGTLVRCTFGGDTGIAERA